METGDFNSPETFKPTSGLVKGTAAPLIILGIPLFLVTWLLAAVITNALKLPAAGILAFVVAALFTALMVWIRIRMLTKNVATIQLVVDERGMTYTGDSSVRFIAWPDLREARRVIPLIGMDAKKAARGVGFDSIAAQGGQAMVNAGGRAGAELTAGTGVVGLGSIEVTGGVMAKETYRQNAGRNGVDKQTGQPYVSIPLSQFDKRWDQHRIGAWLAHHRPDLAEQAAALHRKQDELATMSWGDLVKDAVAEGRAEASAQKQAERDRGDREG